MPRRINPDRIFNDMFTGALMFLTPMADSFKSLFLLNAVLNPDKVTGSKIAKAGMDMGYENRAKTVQASRTLNPR